MRPTRGGNFKKSESTKINEKGARPRQDGANRGLKEDGELGRAGETLIEWQLVLRDQNKFGIKPANTSTNWREDEIFKLG